MLDLEQVTADHDNPSASRPQLLRLDAVPDPLDIVQDDRTLVQMEEEGIVPRDEEQLDIELERVGHPRYAEHVLRERLVAELEQLSGEDRSAEEREFGDQVSGTGGRKVSWRQSVKEFRDVVTWIR